MSLLTNFVGSCLLASSVLTGQALAATPASLAKMPPRQAFAQPSPAASGCMNTSRFVSHAAYLPVDPAQTMPCGHLLSTDTVLTVHHWDKT